MNIKLGIIGGGQLGMYLCNAARKLGVTTTILAEEADMPAVGLADHVLIGPLDDPQIVTSLLSNCDVVTFEKEDIPEATLDRIVAAQQAGEVSAHPSVDALRTIKDKGVQKSWMREHGIATLPFELAAADADATALVKRFGLPFVQKARVGGYDGMGVQIIETEAQLQQFWPVPSVIEAFLPDCREISVLLARGRDGDIAVYPPLGMAFDENLNALSTVITPADIPAALAEEAVSLATSAIEELGEAGVFAVELFIDRDDRLYVNEISPRVHNSGHLTMEACEASQFEQHVRAVTGMDLAAIDEVQAAAMVNILYSEPLRDACPSEPVEENLAEEGITLHWYGKEPGRPGRKMGHITALADSAAEAARLAEKKLAKLNGDEEHEAA